MKRLFLLCLALWLSVPALAQEGAPAVESKLIALENAWNQAQLHHDSRALHTLVADSFVYTDYDGTVMNKPAFLADINDPDYRASLIANEDVSVHLYPGVAVVFGTYHTRGTYKGKPFEHYGRFTDTWISKGSQWQCVASHTNLLRK